jgi:hypothetical protein
MFPSYSELTDDEVKIILEFPMVFRRNEKLNVYEIDCHEKSVLTVQRLLREGRINSYTGISKDEKEILRIKEKGLTGHLIKEDSEIIHDLDELKAAGNGVVVMLGLPETSPEKARQYEQWARERGLDVIVYPPRRA